MARHEGLLELAEPARSILVDCPWRYQNYGAKKHGAARGHYPGMKFEALLEIPVARWAAEGAVLFQWATWPKLDEAMSLVELWGFGHVSAVPWVKTCPSSGEIRCGIGTWAQATSELLIIARRGKVKRLADPPKMRGLLVGSREVDDDAGELWRALDRGLVFYAPRGVHSKKPVGVHEYIERTVPGPRLELFGREERPGWTVWGLELGVKLGPWGAKRARAVRTLPLTSEEKRAARAKERVGCRG